MMKIPVQPAKMRTKIMPRLIPMTKGHQLPKKKHQPKSRLNLKQRPAQVKNNIKKTAIKLIVVFYFYLSCFKLSSAVLIDGKNVS